ncbi:MAG: helix-hairpin-helix domain-containing protein [Deltaproteobacteria bacterium]|nr:helix-hairpin-helix domain-containing protein [Deltaproteobacteria bacterium]MBZ0220622.1 helix-hairpin-helix domain-containing protein [Deltaproteobacteria bacterium]
MARKICHINSSNADDIRKSVGIGDNEARRLVDYRSEHGNFRTLDDLMNVPGFSPDTVEKLKRECDLD